MNRLRWQIKAWLATLGYEGSIGLVLLGLSLIIYLLVLTPTQSRLDELQQQVASLSAQVQSPKNRTSSVPATASDQLLAFYRFFPPQTSAPNWLDKIFKAARQQNLDLPEGKYRVKHERAGPLIRYQVTLPVTGNYQQMHRFLAAVLTGIPNAALDGVTFERHKIGNARIEAKVKITLYLGQQT